MSVDKVLAASQDRKRDGDVLFGRGKFEDAAAVYCDADALLQLPDADSERDTHAVRKIGVMRMILLQNRAACCHKLMRFPEAVELCTAALEFDRNAEQVLQQRARCLMATGDFAAAYGDYSRLAEINPEALEPQRQLQAIAALCPEAADEHRARSGCAGGGGGGVRDALAVSSSAIFIVGWAVAAVAIYLAQREEWGARAGAGSWGQRVWEDWGSLFSALSLASVVTSPLLVSLLPRPDATPHSHLSGMPLPAPACVLPWTPFKAVASCVVSRGASAVAWCVVVPFLVSDGSLIETPGGVFGRSGGGIAWLHLLLASSVVHGLVSALRVPLQLSSIDFVRSMWGRWLGFVELGCAVPVMLSEYAILWLCVKVLQRDEEPGQLLSFLRTIHANDARIESPPRNESPAALALVQKVLLQMALGLYPLQAFVSFQLSLRRLPNALPSSSPARANSRTLRLHPKGS